MDLKLKGKRALVTGASKGIGLAVAHSLAAEGCHLDIAGRGVPALEQARDTIRQAAPGIDVCIHGSDLSRIEDQERLAQACAEVDILVNNAGSNPAGDLDDTSDKIWRNAWDLKVFGYINLTRSIFHAMKQRRDGAIVRHRLSHLTKSMWKLDRGFGSNDRPRACRKRHWRTSSE